MIKDLARCGLWIGTFIVLLGFEFRLFGLNNEGVFTIGLLAVFICGLVYAISDMLS